MLLRYRKNGFTLAEVLITLGIVGIVTAMTLPSVINNVKEAIAVSKYKKHIADLNQAVMMAKVQNDVNFANAIEATTSIKTDGSLKACQNASLNDYSFCGIFNDTLKNVRFIGYNGNNDENILQYRFTGYWNYKVLQTGWQFWLYQFSDGNIMGFNGCHRIFGCRDCTLLNEGEKINQEWRNKHYACFGFIDINGMGPPNKEVTCSDGSETTADIGHPCKVSGKNFTDMIPVVMHDSIVEPGSNAAMYIFQK